MVFWREAENRAEEVDFAAVGRDVGQVFVAARRGAVQDGGEERHLVELRLREEFGPVEIGGCLLVDGVVVGVGLLVGDVEVAVKLADGLVVVLVGVFHHAHIVVGQCVRVVGAVFEQLVEMVADGSGPFACFDGADAHIEVGVGGGAVVLRHLSHQREALLVAFVVVGLDALVEVAAVAAAEVWVAVVALSCRKEWQQRHQQKQEAFHCQMVIIWMGRFRNERRGRCRGWRRRWRNRRRRSVRRGGVF